MSDSSFDFSLDEAVEEVQIGRVFCQPAEFDSPPIFIRQVKIEEDADADLDFSDSGGSFDESAEEEKDNLTPEPITRRQTMKKRAGQVRQLLPLVNRDTTSPDTYDIDYMMRKDVQMRARMGNRFNMSHLSPDGHFQGDLAKSLNYLKRYKDDKQVTVAKSLDVVERLYEKSEKLKQKKDRLRQMLTEEREAECTFTPRVRGESASVQHRSFNEVLSDMEEFDKKRERRLIDLRQSYELSLSLTSSPLISSRSTKLAKKTNNQSVVKRLNKPATVASKQHELCTNHNLKYDLKFEQIPNINSKSQRLNRSHSVFEVLEEDIARRRKLLSTQSSSGASSPRLISQASAKLLEKKLRADLKAALEGVEAELNFSAFQEVFKTLHMNSDETNEDELLELWKQLGGDRNGYVSPADLKVCCLAICNFPLKTSETSNLGSFTPGTLELTKDDAVSLHWKFMELLSSRLSYSRTKEEAALPSFHPELTAKTKMLSKKARANRGTQKDLLDFLLNEKKSLNSKLEALTSQQGSTQRKQKKHRSNSSKQLLTVSKHENSSNQIFAISTEETIFNSPKRRTKAKTSEAVGELPVSTPTVPEKLERSYLRPTASSALKLAPAERKNSLNTSRGGRDSLLNTSNSSRKSFRGNRSMNRSMNKSFNKTFLKRNRFLKKEEDAKEEEDVIVIDVRLSATKTVALVIDKNESIQQAVRVFADANKLSSEAAAKLEKALALHRIT
eukprot:CAMPEP_0204904860 /NCGR_PEP_ID=MMETSP1397-20131031/5096_1 /ASSEMBLY_ACC=CAM_ASM_000891 /TAXON_ID=49980 /ORGANISM="Climacostomum Climacostomum virens, Strain Stock W-24" /LENGTH=729 /DNA_ID=CAMNT_0052073685 /DNA_START=1135 /DNA_END=3324 /DNA_ORIENTATION=+